MLDEFKSSQSLAYKLLTNSVNFNKVSHAYLIDGNNNEFAFDFVMSFVKMLICDNNYSNFDKCGNCNKCLRIDDGNYTEVKVIESNGLVIKKEQLLELQSDFSKSAIESSRRIYIIKDCDKMNSYASNSLLKFLEEPTQDIIAILFTNNIHKILPTIISRCQYIKLSKEKNNQHKTTMVNFANMCCYSSKEVDEFINDESNLDVINSIVEFINYYEENGLDIIIYLKKMWYNNFSERDNCILGLKLMINFYYDVFNHYYNMNNYFFVDYYEKIIKISKYNNDNVIMCKINLCLDALNSLNNNLNVNLVIDNLLIRLEECKYEYS